MGERIGPASLGTCRVLLPDARIGLAGDLPWSLEVLQCWVILNVTWRVQSHVSPRAVQSLFHDKDLMLGDIPAPASQNHLVLGGVTHRASCPGLDTGAPQNVQSIILPGGPCWCWVWPHIGHCAPHWRLKHHTNAVHSTAWGLGGQPDPCRVVVPIQGPVEGGVHS